MQLLIHSRLLALWGLLAAVATDQSVEAQTTASWYGAECAGKPTASGEIFDPTKLTAASWFYPLGTFLMVEMLLHRDPDRSVVVRVNDRGPHRRYVSRGRKIDLSHAAFRRLAKPDVGLINVRITPIPKHRAMAWLAMDAVEGPAKDYSDRFK